jgi:hypothetical protein
MEERWRTVSVAWNYEVSNQGRVRNKRTGRVLKAHPNNRTGRPQVTMMDTGFRITREVHVLVRNAFG